MGLWSKVKRLFGEKPVEQQPRARTVTIEVVADLSNLRGEAYWAARSSLADFRLRQAGREFAAAVIAALEGRP